MTHTELIELRKVQLVAVDLYQEYLEDRRHKIEYLKKTWGIDAGDLTDDELQKVYDINWEEEREIINRPIDEAYGDDDLYDLWKDRQYDRQREQNER